MNFNGELSKLAFAGSPFEAVTVQELIQQIESRRRIEKKLPTWYAIQNIVFPPKLNLEQTSSEVTAQYKAGLVSGKNLADITGGFGVDSYFFSKKFDTVHHFEINKELSEIARHNFGVLGCENIVSTNEDGLETVLKQKFEIIYADPSRRHASKGKVFFLKDCHPNIPENIGAILRNCDSFLLKTSPMLDLSVGISELEGVAEIHIISIDNEVKELLWMLRGGISQPISIKTVNFRDSGIESFDFVWGEKGEPQYQLPQKYLYEPNSAILKSGAFDLISERLGVNKLHKNTHLYTNNALIKFPGRSFKIEERVPYTRSEIRMALNFKKANITTRNFPESVEALRQKWKIADGGNIYLFFVTNSENQKEMIVCSKA